MLDLTVIHDVERRGYRDFMKVEVPTSSKPWEVADYDEHFPGLAPATAQDIYQVRRAQEAIHRQRLELDLDRYLDAERFLRVGGHLVRTYFPRSVARHNVDNVDELTRCYSSALAIAPIICRIPGSYSPDWHIGTVLSWLRRCISKNTGQWYFALVPMDMEIDATKLCRNLDQFRVRSDRAVEAVLQQADLAASRGAKARAAMQFVAPFLNADFDTQVDARFHTRSVAEVRRKLRAKGATVASYLRVHETAFLVADKNAMQSAPELEWQDIRQTALTWRGHVITWHTKESRLSVRIPDAAFAASLREIRAAMKAAPNPRTKFGAAQRICRAFCLQHQYAIDSSKDLWRYQQQVSRLVRRRVTATVPSLTFTPRYGVYPHLVRPIAGPFLLRSNVAVQTWLNWWSPYR